MSRDPFDHLREMNPMPEDLPVYAPMGTADRIAGGPPRRSWPAWALAGSLALAALLAGGGWLLWIRGGTQEIAATSSPGTTQAPGTTTTTAPGVILTGDAVVYFFVEPGGARPGAGPYLIPVARPYAVLSHPVTDPVSETLDFLLIGTYPGEEEAGPALLSYIPEGTRLLGMDVADGVATVDLSSEFTADALVLRRALAQIVFTLTRFADIRAVHFLVEGEPLLSPVRTGIPDPADRADFQDLLPAVMIETPAYWASGGEHPLVVTGNANVFEAVVGLELLDQDGAVLWTGTAVATCGSGCRGDFSTEIPYQVGEGQVGALVAWETSMRDGSRTNVRQHPVWLNATGEPTTTTLDPIAEQLALRYALDKAIDASLAEIEDGDAQLVGLPLDQGTALRPRAAELDRDLSELRDGLSRVFNELQALGADFAIPCSGEALGSELAGQPGLPDGVGAVRTALYEAARACDWDSLRSLIGAGGSFSYSFGESGDPVGYWQRLEFLHYRPMLYIAGILQQPFGRFEGPDGPVVYAWPLAYTYDPWSAVPEDERRALQPLYDALDIARFDEFGGYLGYRVGITGDEDQALWVYAIEGD
jgi:hypothetical protein